ncbi:hypothetical protein SKAU_G00124120 [Synaphobranchus kaupii]|uniref:Ig-like domain-containing protein n=1 Tax=Synaphobranchus kaupii TaxID=118154 RepID=A0A9Q1FP42_SYNKA|nr:hypothetical protein SKAU_G00124120 [Synaphobranchus kaupii]
MLKKKNVDMEVFILAFLWLVVVASAANGLVDLEVKALVRAPCHSSVTLHCNISHVEGLEVEEISWIRMNDLETLCMVNRTEEKKCDSHRIKCSYTPQAQLSLTISHLWPTDQGQHVCKLKSNKGVRNMISTVEVQECYGKVETDASSSGIACHFHGVHPLGKVHWFHHGKNVTFNSTTSNSNKPNHKGMYNVSSTLLTDGDSSYYNCSLWIPNTRTYLTSTLVHAPKKVKGNAGQNEAFVSALIVGLGWFLVQARVLIL